MKNSTLSYKGIELKYDLETTRLIVDIKGMSGKDVIDLFERIVREMQIQKGHTNTVTLKEIIENLPTSEVKVVNK